MIPVAADRTAPLRIAAISLLLLIAACEQNSAPGAGPAAGKKPPLVQLAVVSERVVRHRVERAGTLRAERSARLFNQEEGAVVEVTVREGDVVSQEQLLVRLDDRLLAAQHAKALSQRLQAEADLRRLEKVGVRLVSDEDRARARTALDVARAEERLLATRLDYLRIRAPFAGLITAREINPGDVAPRHSHLLSLIDPDSLRTEVEVSELLLPRLAAGDAADVRIDALGNQQFAGRILRIHPRVNETTRRGIVEVALDPVPPGARAGQFCRVTLTTRDARSLVVPLASVRRDAEGEFVFRFVDGVIERLPVATGLRFGDGVEILSGPSAGERVVRAGFMGLHAGTRVRPAADGEGK
ncbi:MAG: efflux RND transporter periplasmic adaptor subunit [Gammaproteobacteria bacterium]|nr:efflux RND transporter periplasmic adaptor subunit [Gammaproteobacteria bacterium]